MSKLSIGQKAERVVKFLLGLRISAVATALASFGFTAEEQQKGWQLLSCLTQGRLGRPAIVNDDLIVQIDAWENTWFPVAKATLERHVPEAAALVFANLTQTQGPEVVVSVGTFIDRVQRLAKSEKEGGLGKMGKQARLLLTKRGLTPAVIASAKALLDRATVTSEVPAPDLAADDAAEQELWAWYLEWSGIARVAIRDRATLRRLGFAKSGRPPKSVSPAPPPPPTPTPTASPTPANS